MADEPNKRNPDLFRVDIFDVGDGIAMPSGTDPLIDLDLRQTGRALDAAIDWLALSPQIAVRALGRQLAQWRDTGSKEPLESALLPRDGRLASASYAIKLQTRNALLHQIWRDQFTGEPRALAARGIADHWNNYFTRTWPRQRDADQPPTGAQHSSYWRLSKACDRPLAAKQIARILQLDF